VILPAGWRDLGAALEIEKACFGRDAWPWIDVAAALSLPGTVRLKAQAPDRVVGFALGDRWSTGGLAWIASLAVHPEYQRRGIGQRLLRACEEALGTPRIRLTVRASNFPALELYRRAGYSPVDIWRRYYTDGEDGQVMEKQQ
jgi:ribosomal-protein-alanine N-acetyltransferase